MRKLQLVKSKLKEWNNVTFGELRERKLKFLNDIDDIDVLEQEGNLFMEDS